MDENGEDCGLTGSGFRFGMFYGSNYTYPAAGIGCMRGIVSIYLSSGLMHHYDSTTKTANWINTMKNNHNAAFAPCAILVLPVTGTVCGVTRVPGVYILSTPEKVREPNSIIPDSEITVTKLG